MGGFRNVLATLLLFFSENCVYKLLFFTPEKSVKLKKSQLPSFAISETMANNDNFEPMQVDAAEENDNDGDVGVAFQQLEGGGVANESSAGGFGGPGSLPTGNFQRGDIYGENSRVNYNIENPSIDLEAYAQGYTGLAAIYRLRFIAHHCPVLRVLSFASSFFEYISENLFCFRRLKH